MTDRIATDLIALDPRFGPLAEASRRILDLPLDGLLTYLIDTCPSGYLPELVRQFHIGLFEGAQLASTDDERRRLIKESIRLHRRKGTPWAVKRALAFAGFGAGVRLHEHRTPRRYDGTIHASGVEVYGGHSWAEYAIEVDLGEHAGLDAGTGDYVQRIAAEWAPVSRHLTALAWRADVRDDISAQEASITDAQWYGASLRPWRRYYDGSLRYDQGRLLRYDGATQADGTSLYQGYSAEGAEWLAGAPDSDTTLAATWRDADRQQRLPRYDGATQADGSTDYGENAPVAEDAVMPITITRHVCYDGRYRYGADNRFDGRHRFDGRSHYLAGRIASGNDVFYLEAA